jgi:hypothetical protein
MNKPNECHVNDYNYGISSPMSRYLTIAWQLWRTTNGTSRDELDNELGVGPGLC